MVQRILGSYPLTDGPRYSRGKSYSETNLDVGYKITPKLKIQLPIFNLFDSHADSAEYYNATDINASEVAKYGTTGMSDFQVHPLELLSARLTLTASF